MRRKRQLSSMTVQRPQILQFDRCESSVDMDVVGPNRQRPILFQ